MNDTFDAVCTLCDSDENAQKRRYALWTNLLYPDLKDTLALLRTPGDEKIISKKHASDYIKLAEDFFFDVGERDEEYLSIVKRQGLVYREIVPTNIQSSMGSYLDYFRKQSGEGVYALNDCVGILLMIMDTGITPEQLIINVTTPGGCTAVGNDILKNRNTSDILFDVIDKTAKKAFELGK